MRQPGRPGPGGAIALALAMLAALGTPTRAQAPAPGGGADPLSALYLANACQKSLQGARTAADSMSVGFCYGTVITLVHTQDYYEDAGALGNARRFCAPHGQITVEQWVRIFLDYAARHPNQLHLNRVAVLMQAFGEAFPCQRAAPDRRGDGGSIIHD